jgi:hypothetical protein
VTRIRACRFVTDSKRRNEAFWFCTTHQARVCDPLVSCFFSRYDATPFELCSGWSYDGCSRYAYCHATFAPRKPFAPEDVNRRL